MKLRLTALIVIAVVVLVGAGGATIASKTEVKPGLPSCHFEFEDDGGPIRIEATEEARRD